MDLAQLKQQFAKNRAKSIILGVLFAALAAIVTPSLLGGGPRPASAMALLEPAAGAQAPVDGTARAAMEGRMRESRVLWQTLREDRGNCSDAVFTFDSAHFNLDPERAAEHTKTTIKVQPEAGKNSQKSVDEQKLAGKVAQIREEASALHLQSTVMADVPMAVINTGILRVGDQILGFQIIAIRVRQVTLVKDGITVTLEMSK